MILRNPTYDTTQFGLWYYAIRPMILRIRLYQ